MAVRSLRRIIGWTAVLYGGGAAIERLGWIALSRKWLPSALNFGSFTAPQTAIDWAGVAAGALLAWAGVLVLGRAATGPAAVRVAAALMLVPAYARRIDDAMQGRWGVAFSAYGMLQAVLYSSAVPVMLIVLTLGAVGRAVRR